MLCGAMVLLCLIIVMILVLSISRRHQNELLALASTPVPEPEGAEASSSQPQPTEAVPTLAPTDAPTPTPSAAPTAMPTTNEVHSPSPEELSFAIPGVLNTGDVALRAGPTKDHSKLNKYDVGAKLTVYGYESDYFYVKMDSDGAMGYVASKFVALQVPAGTAPGGTVPGLVSANLLSLRNEPDKTTDDNRICYLENGSNVSIYFKTGDFYYVEAHGILGYLFAEHIAVSASVPEGTPLPIQ